ncbi:MAG: ELM1/GtrOC1 family putative glycosyltransferase [Halieaceae bacterium]|nr:ELM1/GtrOC1 family putative glycosyltransferase [Halieaceae bacterium]
MPAIWLIDAYRAGERGQVRALADAVAASLGWPCRRIELDYRSHIILPHILGAASVSGITEASRRALAPPWPDLVITCGVRNEPVCRWIRKQSGGHTRYLHLGRPWGRLDSFDLVVTTPQYRVPDRANVVNNELTLHSFDGDRLQAAGARWAETFASLPPPYVTVNIGGDSGPFTFGPKAAERLAQDASSLARELGGSLLVSTSSRTPVAAADILERNIDVPCHVYRWRPDDQDNPYLGMLALAERLVVTGDSIAMLSEACATGKPVYIYDLGGMREEVPVERDFRWGGFFYGLLMRWLWQRLSRDITLVHRQLLAAQRASWLGEAPPSQAEAPVNDLARAVSATRALLGEPQAVDLE